MIFEIVEYRDFFDVPRLVLAKDKDGGFWIFDSKFMDAEDEYDSFYSIYSVGRDGSEARAVFESVAKNSIEALPVGRLSVALASFDETRKRRVSWGHRS